MMGFIENDKKLSICRIDEGFQCEVIFTICPCHSLQGGNDYIVFRFDI